MDPYEKARKALYAFTGWDVGFVVSEAAEATIDAFLADVPVVCGYRYRSVIGGLCGVPEADHHRLGHPFVPAALVRLGDTDE